MHSSSYRITTRLVSAKEQL